MNQVSPLVAYDKRLRHYTVDFVEDGQNETVVFTNPNLAEKFIKELRAKGFDDMDIY